MDMRSIAIDRGYLALFGSELDGFIIKLLLFLVFFVYVVVNVLIANLASPGAPG